LSTREGRERAHGCEGWRPRGRDGPWVALLGGYARQKRKRERGVVVRGPRRETRRACRQNGDAREEKMERTAQRRSEKGARGVRAEQGQTVAECQDEACRGLMTERWSDGLSGGAPEKVWSRGTVNRGSGRPARRVHGCAATMAAVCRRRGGVCACAGEARACEGSRDVESTSGSGAGAGRRGDACGCAGADGG
jgi:hypothetical protein